MVGNSSATCVKARTDLRIAAAEYLDAALKDGGDNLDSPGLIGRHMLFLEAWQYADNNDADNGQDFGDAASRLTSDAAKALLTGSKDEIEKIILQPIIIGTIAFGGAGNAKGIIGEGGISNQGSNGPADEEIILAGPKKLPSGDILSTQMAPSRGHKAASIWSLAPI